MTQIDIYKQTNRATSKLAFTGFVLLIIICMNSATAQIEQIKNMKKWQLISYGEEAERIGDYYSAIHFYNEYLRRNPRSSEISFKLANLYYKSRDYKNAEITFYKTYELNFNKNLLSLYYYAKMLKEQGKYGDALYYFTNFERLMKKNRKDIIDKSKIENEMDGIGLALIQNDSLNKIRINKLDNSINKSDIEFSPIIVNDSTIAFGSAHSDTLKYNNIELLYDNLYTFKYNKNNFRRFFEAKKDNKGNWTKSKIILHPFFNDSNSNTGSGCFSPDKQRFYFTRCNESWQYKMICNLFVTELNNGLWSNPEKLDEKVNYKNYTTTQPTIGTCYLDYLEILYFVSDRPNGIGGLDIWYSVYNKTSKQYIKAINAGLYINSQGDEITPFFDLKLHALYFSSNTLSGLGGFDVFRSFGDLVNWSDPENIGFPINSSYDDLCFTINNAQDFGFFTSNRTGSNSFIHEHCCDDIYYFQQQKGENILVCGKLIFNDISKEINKQTVYNKDSTEIKTHQRKEVVSLYLIDEKSEPIFIAKDSTGNFGEFSFNVIKNKKYKVIIEDERVIDNFFIFDTQNEQNLQIILDPIQVKIIPDEPILIDNIYYEFNKSDLIKESKIYLDSTLIIFFQKYSNLEIEILSYTDNIGTDEYNMNLSQKRSESVIRYLEEKGVDKNRLTALGLGSKFPITKNVNDDGSDNPDGRKLNRRTEFKITRKREEFVFIK